MNDFDMLPVFLDRIRKKIIKDINADLKKWNLSNMHGMHLMCLFKNKDGLTLTELTNKIGIDKANTTRAINDLILKGYVSKDDKIRGFKVVLTKKGLEVANFFCEHHKQNMEQVLNEFTEEEKIQMFSFLKRIIDKIYMGG